MPLLFLCFDVDILLFFIEVFVFNFLGMIFIFYIYFMFYYKEIMYLTDDLIVKSSMDEKVEQLTNNIVRMIDEILNDNDIKNKNLQRYENIYDKVDLSQYVLEIYDTNLSVIRYSHTDMLYIYYIDDKYLENYTSLSFLKEWKIVLTIFNKIIIYYKKEPYLLIDNIQNVKKILLKLFLNQETDKYLDVLNNKDTIVHDINIIPDILIYEYKQPVDNKFSLQFIK
jgi:hypothetical protein